jgi:hypothetical protein
MPHLYTSFFPAAPNESYVYEKDDAGVRTAKISADVTGMDRRTQPIKYRKSTHLIGTFRRPYVRDRFGGYHLSGVLPPLTQPTLVDASIAGSSTGNMIGYQTFVFKIGDVYMAESNPGPASAKLASLGTGREWDALDWTPADSHVTHSRGYVSVDGALPALAWERPISPTGTKVTEAVSTGALGLTLPVRRALTGYYQLDPFARGIPPYTMFAEEYHDAFFYAGDPNFPERIYPSKLYEPEAVNTTPIFVNGRLDEPWLSTTDGGPVTGIKRQGDELIVGTARGIDSIQGYTYGDYSVRRISNYWNVVSHWSMRRAGPLGSLFFASSQGPTIYNAGSFRYIGGNIQTWWRDEFRANPALFEDCFGVEDQHWETYNLLIPQAAAPLSLWWVVDYNSAEFGRPVWVEDLRDRKDWVSEELQVNAASRYWERYTGSCDGKVRQENVETDPDDDGDTYLKKGTIQFPHTYPEGDQGGHEGQGHTYVGVDLFLKHETNSVTASIYGGDDDAPAAVAPHWTRALAASAPSTGARSRVSRTSQHETLSKSSGKGVTLKLEVTSPLSVECRGWGVDYVKGPQTRPFK